MLKKNKIFLIILISFSFFILLDLHSFAQTIDELQSKITEREAAIKDLEAQIADTQKQIDSNQSQQKTLKGAIATLDAERKKVLAQISLTQQKIAAKELEIESLGYSIDDKNKSINDSNYGLSEIIREMYNIESEDYVEVILNNKNLSQVWDTINQIIIINQALINHVNDLKNFKQSLEKDKVTAESIRKDLVNLNVELAGRKKIAEAAQADQQKLLTQTKNQESAYQKMLAKQLADKNAFEQDLLDFESQLKYAVDPKSLPSSGSGVLHWPLDSIKITQYFGNTDFSTKNPQIYNGMGHNGVDFRASVGTPIKAALSGVIKGLGNTDTACPGASYGKWILIEHSNGLSTLYAHLSAFAVQTGDKISTGGVIGWSGNTGYTTGPHLHFTVYATQGVQIMSRASKACSGGIYTMPIASLNAYLNPLSYL